MGTLYLNTEYIQEAERCFLISHNIKKELHPKYSTRKLVSLFNLYECNIYNKNFDQAEKILDVAQAIISLVKAKKALYNCSILRRRGKISFLQGKLSLAEKFYEEGKQELQNKHMYSLEQAELWNCIGLLRLEQKRYKEAKDNFESTMKLMNFYFCKESNTILTLKKNLNHAKERINPDDARAV